MNLQQIKEVLFFGKSVRPDGDAIRKIEDNYHFLENFSKDKIIYGINTGFGPMAQYRIDDKDLKNLQYNIIRSHATGAGAPLPPLYAKAAMLARLQTFLQARSGVHPNLVRILADFIDSDICPVIPEHGSVGASGDLVQLAHLALALIGEGDVFYRGEQRPAAAVLKETGIEPLRMHIREGLAVTNGTGVMTGIGLINLIHAEKLLGHALMLSVLVNEIASSYDDFMAEELNACKQHPGQREIARAMRESGRGSRCLLKRELELFRPGHTEKIFTHKVQPYYSLRCIPQILGPVYDTLRNTEEVLLHEFNSADDNPIVDNAAGNIFHGGNFHGDYVSFEMDKLKIAVTKMTMLCERQMNYLFHDRINGILPPFVNMGILGLNYGLQASQFTATSTTAECQTLSNPMYIHSIPNNNDNQDIVSMGTNSALLARRIIDNAYQVFAIHCMAAAQAVDCLRIADKLAPATRKMYNRIRELVPAFIEDTPKYEEIGRLEHFLRTADPEIIWHK